MEPQIGPKEAPMRPKTLPRLKAQPLAAMMSDTIAPMITITVLFTLGNIVPMLLAAMKELKHAGAKLAMANKANISLAPACCPMMTLNV